MAMTPEAPAAVPLDFDGFFRDRFPQVARAATLIARDPALGAEIAQESFARAFERWDRLASEEHARNFVFRVAVNLARSHVRRRLASPFGLRGPETSAADPSVQTTDRLLVFEALRHVSPKQRTAVVLVDYADMDAATAGQVMGIGEGTVRVHLMRGRRALRERLDMRVEVEE